MHCKSCHLLQFERNILHTLGLLVRGVLYIPSRYAPRL